MPKSFIRVQFIGGYEKDGILVSSEHVTERVAELTDLRAYALSLFPDASYVRFVRLMD